MTPQWELGLQPLAPPPAQAAGLESGHADPDSPMSKAAALVTLCLSLPLTPWTLPWPGQLCPAVVATQEVPLPQAPLPLSISGTVGCRKERMQGQSGCSDIIGVLGLFWDTIKLFCSWGW